MMRVIHQEIAKIGDTIVATYNSHVGRTAIVHNVNDVKCTVEFTDGEPGLYIKHGDYRIVDKGKKKKGKTNVDKAASSKDIKFVQDRVNNKDELKSKAMRIEVTHDMINIAAKVAALTDNEMEASNLITQISEGIEEMTMDLIEQQTKRNSK